jgi:hypothetical protein
LTEKKEKKEPVIGPDGEVCRDLICAEEWKDPETRKVLTEYHKRGLPKEMAGVDADLESFEQYWKKKGGTVKVKGEYHKDGAPYLDGGIGSEAAPLKTTSTPDPVISAPIEQKIAEKPEGKTNGPSPPPEAQSSSGPAGTIPSGNIQRPIDLGMIEMVSYALFRVAFSKGVRIPIKRDGMIDMDVTVKGKEITINTNQLFFSVPELNVWHIVYEHKGKPIVELGRGVKNGVKIHRLQAIRLGLEMWNGSRKMNKMRLKALKEADTTAHARPQDE